MMDAILNNREFYEYYLNDYAERCTKSSYSSLIYYLVNVLGKENPNVKINPRDLESINENAKISNTNAINYLFNQEEVIEKLYPHNIMQTAYLITEPYGYSYGYRKTTVAINRKVSFTPVSAKDIPSKMMSLIDSYNNIWLNNDIVEKEARFHIEIARIQPFEDGNKRTAQMLTAFNLMKNGYLPIVITEEDRNKYIEFIDKYDVKGFANFIREKEKFEQVYITELYTKYCKNSIGLATQK
jgi:prophage maintenance system killer protein